MCCGCRRKRNRSRAFVGKRVHEVLERLYLFTTSGKVPSLARVLERFRIWWDEHYDPQRVRIVRSENDAAHYRQLGERCLTNYYRRFYPFDGDETLAVEKHVTFSLDEEGAYRIRGVIDRVARARDGAIEIQDYKTSQRVPSQERLDKDRQLALYQMGIAEHFGYDRRGAPRLALPAPQPGAQPRAAPRSSSRRCAARRSG